MSVELFNSTSWVLVSDQIAKNYADATPLLWILFAAVAVYVAYKLITKRRKKGRLR